MTPGIVKLLERLIVSGNSKRDDLQRKYWVILQKFICQVTTTLNWKGVSANVWHRPTTYFPRQLREVLELRETTMRNYSRLSELGSLLGISNFDPIGEVTLVLRDFNFSNGMLRG